MVGQAANAWYIIGVEGQLHFTGLSYCRWVRSYDFMSSKLMYTVPFHLALKTISIRVASAIQQGTVHCNISAMYNVRAVWKNTCIGLCYVTQKIVLIKLLHICMYVTMQHNGMGDRSINMYMYMYLVHVVQPFKLYVSYSLLYCLLQ